MGATGTGICTLWSIFESAGGEPMALDTGLGFVAFAAWYSSSDFFVLNDAFPLYVDEI